MQAKKNECKRRPFAVIFLAATIFGTGTSVVSYGAFGSEAMALRTEAEQNADPKPEAAAKQRQRLDLYGEPLPRGSIARMGTMQFHQPLAKEKSFLSHPPGAPFCRGK
ncbi:MAG: hypothetical protein ACYC3I_03965 [Gemmataceae bacterium]